MNTDNYFAAISRVFLSRPELSFPLLFHSNDNRSNRLKNIFKYFRAKYNPIQYQIKELQTLW